MAIKARVLARSKAPCGKIVTTYEGIYPRMIHDELLTHGALARNSASSRAIPVSKMIRRIIDDPWIPSYIGSNQRGMQAGEELAEADRARAVNEWLVARDFAVAQAEVLEDLKVHKQVTNRILQPWMWITVIITMTEDDNFFGLRDHPMAEPHFQELARAMRAARDAREPRLLAPGEWHLPLFGAENGGHVDDWPALDAMLGDGSFCREVTAAKISAGRCGRVSYLTHDQRHDLADDLRVFAKLAENRPMHASPLQHPCQALDWPAWFKEEYPQLVELGVNGLQDALIEDKEDREARGHGVGPTRAHADAWAALAELRSGQFLGFRQLRKTFKDENIGSRAP
jgi:hypothetical protein